MDDRSHNSRSPSNDQVTLRFDLDRWTWVALVTALLVALAQLMVGLLVAAGVQRRFVALLYYFDSNGALTFNAWFSSLLIAGVAVGAVAASRRVEDPGLMRRLVVVAAVVLYLSLDKATGLHQTIALLAPRYIDYNNPIWSAIVLVVLVGLVVFLVGLFRLVPRAPAVGLLVGGAVFVLGAVVLDSFGGAGSFDAVDGWTIVEELAETLGMIIVGRTFFLIVRDGLDGFEVRQVLTPWRREADATTT